MMARLEQNAKALRGVRYAWQSNYLCHRGGSDQASVILGGHDMRFVVHACEEQPRGAALPTLVKLSSGESSSRLGLKRPCSELRRRGPNG